MSNYPQSIKNRQDLNLRLGIKSSLSDLRKVVASLYVIFVANGKKSSVIYADEYNDGDTLKLRLNSNLYDNISSFFDNNIADEVNTSPLLQSQLEPLQVGLELFFKLAKIDFVKSGISERTGSNRYKKLIKFSTNILQIDLFLDAFNKNDVIKFIDSWLNNTPSSANKIEDGCKLLLSCFSEETQFKTRIDSNGTEIIFQREGIYSEVLSNGNVLSRDFKEQVGPNRILKNYIDSNMHPYLCSNDEQNIYFIKPSALDKFEQYSNMVTTMLDLSPKKVHDEKNHNYRKDIFSINDNRYSSFLHAFRTKPFLLLAGISGTGKSRKVRELAFKSCPEYLRDADGTTPGNYCMIEVKPNWHDSSEILGYYSSIASEYRFTKFVKFLVKATLHPDVPFFVCLDEMNLAPVEQYFAEILSVLETRKKVGKHIKTGIIVEGKHFKNAGKTKQCTDNREVYMKLLETTSEHVNEEVANSDSLIEKGLTLPDNVFIVGTVNMDDTTHQFSRKVIDRAMTIEMNGEDLSKMFETFDDLKYLDEKDVWPLEKFAPKYVTADEALDEHPAEANDIKQKLTERLKAINDILNGTPFVVSYRVLNELCIYTTVLRDDGMSLDDAIDTAVDQITLMKILPRIEGDEDMFAVKDNENNRLVLLKNLFAEKSDSYKKLAEMNERLANCGFTRFWP